ncbi:hypothetical protein GCM10007276_23790 [Agaricicola taiwanensis]|uniref:DUF2189 domain-containing protein n=1 Tax=Agaricicola taiwanensis TaxID=591372 RepID=A0A8J3DVY6_9RHOB|nr:DUF2189 domain-containing protein [Agaricicola taiwanensis]GGE45798.1 hypothetical protein GCM10007276_23790 [Agaricicola taiwanensis]
MTIGNPAQWGVDQLRSAVQAAEATGHMLHRPQESMQSDEPVIRRISVRDIETALSRGLDDFAANRTDVVFITLIYPLAGLLLAGLLLQERLLPLIFPLVSGFALVGPFAAAGLYEISRRRERGEPVTWSDAFKVTQRPSFGGVVLLGAILFGIFILWMLSAMAIYWLTFGGETPASLSAFIAQVLGTPRGWLLMGLGIGVGFVFAVIVLAISVVSFPLMLDRNVTVATAMRASVRVVMTNPVPMFLWGAIVAACLALGALPALLGLIIALPVLGHATWHLYRRAIA